MGFDFSLVTAPFRMQPGLRRVAPGASQLTPNLPGSRHLREKLAVLGSAPHEALCAVSGFDDSDVLRAIGSEAARSCPDAFGLDAAIWLVAALTFASGVVAASRMREMATASGRQGD